MESDPALFLKLFSLSAIIAVILFVCALHDRKMKRTKAPTRKRKVSENPNFNGRDSGFADNTTMFDESDEDPNFCINKETVIALDLGSLNVSGCRRYDRGNVTVLIWPE